MFNMEILALLLLSLSLASGQQQPRNPRFRNQGFQNVRTPLATSAARDRPFISIPIVLLPDGRPLPKPKHATYHYVGHATQQQSNRQQQTNNHQRNGKPRQQQQVGRQAVVNYQVAIPPPVAATPPQKKGGTKLPKLTTSQLSGHIRSAQNNNYAKYRGPAPQQRPQQQTFEQTQQMHQIQFVKQQQRSPAFQQQQGTAPSLQSAMTHKQNVANFVNFATNLGAAIAAQQPNPQVILPTQTPASGLTFNNQANHKIAESYLSQRPLISNHKLNNGVTYQHQVPNTQAAHAHYTQVAPNNAENHNNGYAVHQQQQQQTSQQQQQQQQHEQTQDHSQGSTQSESQYLSATSVRSNTHTPNQGTDLQNSAPYTPSQASAFQQSSNNSPRSQATQGNAGLVASNFNSQLQQGNQQSYAAVATTQQQSTPSPQIPTAYGTQAQLPKGVLSVQQQSSGASGLALSPQNLQSSYVNQNQEAQQNQNADSQSQQISYSNSPQTPSLGYSTAQVSQANSFGLQNVQANGGQVNDPLSYYQYHTAQELPLNFPAIFNQAQSGYLSSPQNIQQNNPNSQELDQPYAILPSAQNLYASSVGPAIYVSPQQQEENTSNDSPSEIGVQTYEAYSSDQSTYPSATNQGNQGSQGSYISAQNIEKNYQNPQFGYLLQNSPESQNAPNDGQLPQSASSLGTGHLLYDSSSPKQINYSPASTTFSAQPQQYSSANYQNSPSYISFAASNSNYKSESQPSLNYGQQRPQGVGTQAVANPGAVNTGGIVTPGSTYAKLNQNDAKQQQASEQTDEGQEDSDYDEEEETNDDEASYKVVYIPLDILKNILSNSVENK